LGFIVAAAFTDYLVRRNHRRFLPDRCESLQYTGYYIALSAPQPLLSMSVG
jgi:hypothetical protein